MKIRTSLGAGIAAAAVASTVIGVATPALATPATWSTPVGTAGTQTAGMAVSSDGSTAYVVAGGGPDGLSVTPVDLSTGLAGSPVTFPASYAVGTPVANGDTVAIAANSNEVWTVSGGQATAITLPDGTDAGISISGVTTTVDGFVALGTAGNCLATWTWAAADTAAIESAPVCTDGHVYTASSIITTDPTSGTAFAVVDDIGDSVTRQLWNLDQPDGAPIDLPAGLGGAMGMTIGSDGTVYIAGSGIDDSETQVASVHPGDPAADTLQATGAVPTGWTQVGVVGSDLWLGAWGGISVVDPADTTYTPDAPAPVLTTSSGAPQNFITTADADYLLLSSDNDLAGAPALIQVVAPSAPTPTATLSGTTATVAWDAAENGGTTITSASVTAIDTATGTPFKTVTTTFDGVDGYLDGTAATVDVSGLVRGHSYTFAVTQGNGFFTGAAAATSAVDVPLLATAKPSKVAVTGSPQVGRKLTITTTGSWQSGAALTYAWYAGTTKVGTAASYTPKAADAGKKIKVAVTGTASGRAPSTVTSAYVGPVTKPVYKVPNKPTITGTAKVGSILTAHITGLPAGAVVKYQWAFNGGQYGGAIGRPTTSTTLKVPASVKGTRIEVIAFVTVPGYQTGSAMSGLTAVVK
ncbi:hypothetical protein [Nocardioides ultimimeridianus]